MSKPEESAARFLGYVQLRVGQAVVALPVQALPLGGGGRTDGGASPGGFFTEASGRLGILVDSDGTEAEVKARIDEAIADAVVHLSKRVLN